MSDAQMVQISEAIEEVMNKFRKWLMLLSARALNVTFGKVQWLPGIAKDGCLYLKFSQFWTSNMSVNVHSWFVDS